MRNAIIKLLKKLKLHLINAYEVL